MERLPFRATQLASAYESLGKLPVAVLLDNVRSMYNVGAFFRTADAAGVERLLLTGITAYPPKPGIRKTALGAEETVQWEHARDPMPLVDGLVAAGYQLAAIGATRTSAFRCWVASIRSTSPRRAAWWCSSCCGNSGRWREPSFDWRLVRCGPPAVSLPRPRRRLRRC